MHLRSLEDFAADEALDLSAYLFSRDIHLSGDYSITLQSAAKALVVNYLIRLLTGLLTLFPGYSIPLCLFGLTTGEYSGLTRF